MTEFKVNRTALIDGDFVAYQTAAWAQSSQSDAMDMQERLLGQLEDWRKRACCNQSIVTLSCSSEDGFRRAAYPLYKLNRTAEPPPMLDAAKGIIRNTFKTLEMATLEADDIMGILSTNGKVENPVIVSVDKDMTQVPGWYFNPDKMDFPVLITLAEADYRFYMQWLTGDSTDGFKGIDGLGPKKAEKILPSVYDMASLTDSALIALVASAYADHKKKYTVDYCESQARCARILRASDWGSEKKKPILFTIPEELRWIQTKD